LAQDPGQAGKDQVQSLIRMLAGYIVRAYRATGSKETRADAFSAQVNAGNVRLLKADWNAAYVEELRAFPFGKHDDQIDGSADGFTELAQKRVGRAA
jgi:predicted phage terminase large subunit-like protein